jgi:amino acid adenylation domain-containing protein
MTMTEKDKSILELLSQLKRLGVKVQVDKDKLRMDAPRGFLTHSMREELSRLKPQIIEYLVTHGFAHASGLTSISRISRDRSLPLSFSQERLWFLHQLEPESTAYSMPGSLRLKGRLDTEAFEQAFVELARRHEALRTTFRSVDGRPEQVIAPDPAISVEMVDLRKLPLHERQPEAIRLTEVESRKPFDLVSGPLFRVTLYQLDDGDHMMHLNMHHIISDYWSFGVMNREFGELYRAFVTGTTPLLPTLPIQYADFAYWQREWLQGDVLAAYLGYWKKKLGGGLAALDLPIDRRRPAVQKHRGAEQSMILPQGLIVALRDLSRREGVSLFMVLLAAFKVLLFRYTGQEDIVVGTPIAGRNRVELEGLIGFFINTIIMRTDLSGDPSFKGLLERVRETALDAYSHQEMPFEKLVEEFAPKRDLSRTPLFQIFFNHFRIDKSHMELPRLEVEVGGEIEREAKFDMTLYVREQADVIRLRALYNADLFDAEQIVTMLEQYQELLTQAVKAPEKGISEYSLLTSPQEEQLPAPTEPLTAQWAGAVHERFSAQARRVSEHTAVVDARGSWSYDELERCSNQLADYLRLKGIRPGDVIAIYGHRSAGLVLALLGVLKAGATILILDPSYPTFRLVLMLEDASPRGWLRIEPAGPGDDKLNEWVEASQVVCRLTIPGTKKDVEALLQGMSSRPPDAGVTPDDTAYVIFTSGTTGQPKGIVGTHRPLSHFLDWHCRTFDLKQSDRFSMLSGLSHDPLLRDIFTPLWLGATLCIPEQEEMLIPERFRQWMREQGVTVSHMTPAFGQVLAEGFLDSNSGDEVLSAMHHIFFGGDVLTGQHVRMVRGVAPSVECVNFYGTTETPQAMAYHAVDTDERDGDKKRIPLGRGIDGAQLLILNSTGRLAGVGELGEIHVRTPYLSKGYLNDSALTQAKYIQNPYSAVAGDRLYKTGDLGRYLPNGEVVSWGRRDGQVQLRGFRVELGEIEAVIRGMESVRDCAVILREDRAGEQRLVAYYVPVDNQTVSVSELRGHLRAKLPEYMLPQHLLELAAIPLTPNGKVDRKGLPKPEAKIGGEDLYSAPRTVMEKRIAEIWRDLLDVERVGVNDNFFDLGGHSLLSMRVVARLEKIVGLRINPRELIFQTLGQLASTCEKGGIVLEKRSEELGSDLTEESREPFYFGNGDNHLFGCYHKPRKNSNSRCGIVLCYPVWQEYIRSHRAFVQLAARMTHAGFHVLRFDYYGTGDSAGDCVQGSIRRWVDDISCAIDELKLRGGLEKVCLVGLRLGGTLSVMAGVERNDVEGIVLWNPVVNGGAYIEELKSLQRDLVRFSYVSKGKTKSKIYDELLGFRIPKLILSELEGIDLLQIGSVPAKRICILENSSRPDAKELRDYFVRFDDQLSYQSFPDPKIWLQEPFQGLVPHRTLSSILAWITDVCL